ncbi:TonB-dependent receptor domain-containing protein [Sandarakinorhabdus sp.]|uniref:TonB-dependent receptor domain-containing protein n=1 Tax=Sandarakinorhabdus sp. TaxID=1916663 RepID=UPI003F7294F5
MVAILLLAGASSAYAQQATPPVAQTVAQTAAVAEAADEQITVTGSRITRSGFDQPTPVTVIGEAEIQSAAQPNLADFVNQLPSVIGSQAPSNSQRLLSAGSAGINTLNLRNLGTNRTLILLDGRRSVGSTAIGTVDINTIPQGLVKGVEIVTGGASSVYGSDAVAGVVNFILDKTFTGLKGEVAYGETTFGDDKNYRVSLTGGTSFAGGRGHVLFSGDYLRRDGIIGAPRPWARDNPHLTLNPRFVAGNGEPEYLAATQSGLNNLTAGGIIVSGPARGTYFGPGGVARQYNYGPDRLNNREWTIGGDWEQNQHFDRTSLQPEENFASGFARTSFDVTNRFTIFAEATYNWSRAYNDGGYFTSKGNIAIRNDNAFIPASVRSLIGTSNLTIGSWDADLPSRQSNNTRRLQRYVAGFNGSFDLLGLDWGVDGYYQHGVTKAREQLLQTINRTRLNFARDAVLNSTGQIVCRVTRDGSTNPLAAGCLPYNSFGTGVNSQAVVDYIIGDPFRIQTFKQDVASVNFNTKIDNGLIDPIGLAFGVERRRESIAGEVSPGGNSGWVVGNYEATFGSFTVTEAYLETLFILPLGFELSGAARYTSYSQAGDVVTWKVGGAWQPFADLRIRATRSRDIRAPNLSELFQAGSRNTNSVSDPWQNNLSVRYTQTVTGNLALQPEEADTLGLGFVYRPSYLPGFGLSVDYYDIKINDAIGNLGPQNIVDRCFDGNTQLCQRLTAIIGNNNVAFGSPGFTQGGGAPGVSEFLIANSPFNFLSQRARGMDFEASYRFTLASIASTLPGSIAIRAVATHFIENSQSNGVDPPTDTAGQNTNNGPPSWTYRGTLDYNVDSFNMQFVVRGLSGGVYNNDWFECTSGCPATNAINRTIANNRIPGATYVDASFAYTLPLDKFKPQLFFRVQNLLNTDPVKVGKGPSDTSNVEVGGNQTLYDYLGRTFRIGLRFNFAG